MGILDKLLGRREEKRYVGIVAKFEWVVTFNSNDREILREIGEKVLAEADAELKNKIGRWLVSVDKVSHIEKEPLAIFSMTVCCDISHMTEVKDTLNKWWRHYAKIYNVYD